MRVRPRWPHRRDLRGSLAHSLKLRLLRHSPLSITMLGWIVVGYGQLAASGLLVELAQLDAARLDTNVPHGRAYSGATHRIPIRAWRWFGHRQGSQAGPPKTHYSASEWLWLEFLWSVRSKGFLNKRENFTRQ